MSSSESIEGELLHAFKKIAQATNFSDQDIMRIIESRSTPRKALRALQNSAKTKTKDKKQIYSALAKTTDLIRAVHEQKDIIVRFEAATGEFTKLMERMKARETAVGNLISEEARLIDLEEETEDGNKGNKIIGDNDEAQTEVEVTAHWVGPREEFN